MGRQRAWYIVAACQWIKLPHVGGSGCRMSLAHCGRLLTQVPVLVINQARDRMTAPAITEHNYERLGGPKAYAEVDYGHYAVLEGVSQDVADAVDDWFRKHLPTC